MTLTGESLYAQALRMAVDKNLHDVATLLLWTRECADTREKAHHVSRAIALLHDVHAQLQDPAAR